MPPTAAEIVPPPLPPPPPTDWAKMPIDWFPPVVIAPLSLTVTVSE